MTTAVSSTVIGLPLQRNMHLYYGGIRFRVTNITQPDSAYLKILNPAGNEHVATFTAKVIDGNLVWVLSKEEIDYIEHGSKFRVYVMRQGKRKLEVAGKCLWNR